MQLILLQVAANTLKNKKLLQYYIQRIRNMKHTGTHTHLQIHNYYTDMFFYAIQISSIPNFSLNDVTDFAFIYKIQQASEA